MEGLRTWLLRATTRGLRAALRNLWTEIAVRNRHVAGRRRAASLHMRHAKVQLACGGNHKPGWINVDLFAAGADLTLDLREDLPFSSASVSFVYSEHFLEHLLYPAEVKRLLSELFRVLEPGGILSVVVPDAQKTLHAYADPTDEFFSDRRLRSYLASEYPTRMHHVNYTFRADGQHKYAYDEETLAQVLRAAGFTAVGRRPFDESLDSAKRRGHSLYMQAMKPGC